MKKIKFDFNTFNKVLIVLLMIVAIMMSTNYKPIGNVILDPFGKYEDCVYFSHGLIGDFTRYAKYYYSSIDTSKNNNFKKIQENDLVKLNELIDDFEGLIESYHWDYYLDDEEVQELANNYDFDRSIIDDEDFIYIEVDEFTNESEGVSYTVLASYDVYFLDIQTNVVYYFHNNI